MSYINPSKSVEWQTPLDLFDFLDEEFGPFHLDAAATRENALCKMHFTKEDDSLKQNWFGNVYCNPPYGRELASWIAKAQKEIAENVNVKSVTMLLPARTDTKWFHKIYLQPNVEMYFIKGRLKYSGYSTPAGFGSMILRFTNEAKKPFRVGAFRRDTPSSQWEGSYLST